MPVSATKRIVLDRLAGAVAMLDSALWELWRMTPRDIPTGATIPDIDAAEVALFRSVRDARIALMGAMSRIQATDNDGRVRDIYYDAIARGAAHASVANGEIARLLDVDSGMHVTATMRGRVFMIVRALARMLAKLNGLGA